jgi:hypothetical protein
MTPPGSRAAKKGGSCRRGPPRRIRPATRRQALESERSSREDPGGPAGRLDMPCSANARAAAPAAAHTADQPPPPPPLLPPLALPLTPIRVRGGRA